MISCPFGMWLLLGFGFEWEAFSFLGDILFVSLEPIPCISPFTFFLLSLHIFYTMCGVGEIPYTFDTLYTSFICFTAVVSMLFNIYLGRLG